MRIYALDAANLKDPAKDGAIGPDGRLQVLPAEFWAKYSQEERFAFGVLNACYCIPTTELVQWLKDELPPSTIEIGSGNGVLCDALGVIGTDNKMQAWSEIRAMYGQLRQPTIDYPRNVKMCDANLAVQLFEPHTVLAAWVTHHYAGNPKAGGNMYGVHEEQILERARHVFIGNDAVHSKKPILQLPHKRLEFPWLVSRGLGKDFIAIWEKR